MFRFFRNAEILGKYLLIFFLVSVFCLPFFWMFTSSFKMPEHIWITPPKWIPNPVVLTNYPEALKAMRFTQALINTSIITAATMIGSSLSSIVVAYGFSRFRFRFKKFLFGLVLSTMILPYFVTVIPQFLIFSRLGWINTFYPLIVPAFFGVPFFIFLLRQFFMTIPLELDDAAKIDGCGSLGILFRIMLPLTKPALATVAVFQFLNAWNDFMGPLIYLNQAAKYPLSLMLFIFRLDAGTEWHLLMAASVVVAIPCVVVFFLAQKSFVEGIAVTGMKG